MVLNITRNLLILFILILFFGAKGIGQVDLPEDFVDELLPISIERPVGILFSNDGFGFIHQKVGRIYCMDTSGVLYADPVLDISEEVTAYGDHGLIGFVLDPDFISNGFVYLYYVVDRHYLKFFGTPQYDPTITIENQASIGRITRYQLDITNGYKTMVPNSRKVILGKDFEDGIPILMISHGVGSLVFGQDRTLLVSVGDAGSFTEKDKGNAVDTYHEQSIEDGTLEAFQNVGSFRSMLKNSLNGRVLRIDPETGLGVSSNPFFDSDDPGSDASRTWVMGFRNPYHFIHVQNTGEHDPELGAPGLFILGDVGASSWEELNYITEGGKWYGWPMYEGFYGNWQFQGFKVEDKEVPNPLYDKNGCEQAFLNFQDIYADDHAFSQIQRANPCDQEVNIPFDQIQVHTRPKISYNNNLWNPPARTEVGGFKEDGSATSISVLDDLSGMGESSILEGGSCIPGAINYYNQFPSSYSNNLFTVDYHGFIASIALDENYEPTEIKKFVDVKKGITSCAFSPKDGRLYYVNHLDSEIRRIEYGGILPPTAIFTMDKTYGPGPLTVNFDASQSYSNSGTPIIYNWDFGDGIEGEGNQVQHTFTGDEIQSFEVILTVTDSLGLYRSQHGLISINNTPPVPNITSIEDGSTYSTDGYTVGQLKAEVFDNEHTANELEFVWHVDFYHDEHYHPGPPIASEEAYVIFDPLGCEEEEYWYQIYLEVTDGGGLKGVDSIFIYPYCGPDFVKFMNLKAEKIRDEIELSWETSFEDQLDTFIIERAPDHLFQSIGSLKAGDAHYKFIDKAPLTGLNFYRIRGVNQNGDYSFSNIIKIELATSNIFKIFPNPNDGHFIFRHFSGTNEPIEMKIYSLGGKLLETKIIQNKFELVEQEQVDLSELEHGIYFIQILLGDYHETFKWLKF